MTAMLRPTPGGPGRLAQPADRRRAPHTRAAMFRSAVLAAGLSLIVAAAPAGGQKLENLPQGKPGHPDDLLVGPTQVTIDRKDATGRAESKEVTLLFLTRYQVIYRDRPDGPAVVAEGNRVRRVVTPNRKQTWEWDDAGK